jgi:replication factor A1
MAYNGPQLSRSSIRAIVNGGAVDLRPVLQVIDMKLLNPTSGPAPSTERFRLMLSDGEHYQQAMLATQLNELAKNGTLARNAVVRVNECVAARDARREGAQRGARAGERAAQGWAHAFCARRLRGVADAARALPPREQVHLQRGAEPQVRAGREAARGRRTARCLETRGSLSRRCRLARNRRALTRLAGRRIVIVLQVEPLAAASEVLGAPQPLDGAPGGGAEGSVNGAPAAAPPPAPAPAYGGGGGYGAPAPAYGAPAYGAPPAPAPAYGAQGPAAPAHGGGYGGGGGAPPANYGGGGGAVARNDNGTRYMDLMDLNPYANRWTVKVRVTSKGPIKTFNNAKGEGKLCNFDIMDHVRLPARCAAALRPNPDDTFCVWLSRRRLASRRAWLASPTRWTSSTRC